MKKQRKSVKFLALRANQRNWNIKLKSKEYFTLSREKNRKCKEILELLHFFHFVEIKTCIYMYIYGRHAYFLFFGNNINHERFFHFLEIKRINVVKYFQISGDEIKYVNKHRK